MTARTTVHRLQVATPLHRFIEDQVLPGTGIDSATFWSGFDAIVHDLAPRNLALLAERDRLQAELDRWHAAGRVAGVNYPDRLASIILTGAVGRYHGFLFALRCRLAGKAARRR